MTSSVKKAVILAAGSSQRLSALKLNLPKPMIVWSGKPLLQHHIERCVQAGITDIYVNLHHLPEKITDFFGDGSRWGAKISYHFENQLLGTGGAVKSFEPELSSESFLVIYGDNGWDYSVSEIVQKHETADADMSIVLFEQEEVSQSGVVEFNSTHARIHSFIEKPTPGTTQSHWVNAGIYVLSGDLMKEVPPGFSDFGKDLIPKFLAEGKKLYAIPMSTPVIAIDTPELLQRISHE